MKTQKITLLLSLAALGMSLAACQNNEATSSIIPASSEVPSAMDKSFTVAKIPDLTLGDKIDLKDYVTVPEGSVWEYALLSDGVHEDALSVLSASAPSLSASTNLQAVRPGIATLRFTCGDEQQIVTIQVKPSEAFSSVVQYFSTNLAQSNFTIRRKFALSGTGTVSSDDAPVVYRNENYLYYPEAYYGLAMNRNSNLGYYFQLNGADSVYASSFHAGVTGTYSSDETVTRDDFEAKMPAPGTYWTAENLMYNPRIAQYFGDKYAVSLTYNSDQADLFATARSLFNIPSYRIFGSAYYWPAAFCPVMENGTLAVYVIFARSQTAITSTSILAGPYVFENVGNTVINVIDEFYEGAAPAALSSNDTFLSKTGGFKSYTTSCEGHYEDLEGNRVDAPDYFAKSLPELSVKTRVEDGVGFETTRLDLIDKGDVTHALLYNGKEGGNDMCYKYVLNEEGKYTSVAPYGKDPTSGNAVLKWGSASTFSAYQPTIVFRKSTWQYPQFVAVQGEENTYELMAWNDMIARSAIDALVAGLVGEPISSTSSPFYYYGVYQYLKINIGATSTDDMRGEIYTRVIDSSSRVDHYYHYHLTFTITDINNTNIAVPEAA